MSSNFERLLWFLAYDVYCSAAADVQEKRQIAGSKVKEWQTALKTNGAFSVEQKVLDAAREGFASERVSDPETLSTIRDIYRSEGYILDPHSAIGVTAALRLLDPDSAIGATAALRSPKAAPRIHNVALATAHPAKFSSAVELALKDEKDFRFEALLPQEFVGMDQLPKRITHVKRSGGLEGIRELIVDRVRNEVGIM